MQIPDDYIDQLSDELSPYGFESGTVADTDDDTTEVIFEAEPESFVRAHPGLGIEESYGADWPPDTLNLKLQFDAHQNPIQIDFEVFDLLAWAASADAELHSRLCSMSDPGEHAIAVGEAMGRVLDNERMPPDDYLD